MGQVVETLPEGAPVAGVTSLGEEIYLLRGKAIDQVEVYEVISYRLVRCLTVPNARGFNDMTSCPDVLCLFICDSMAESVHRLNLPSGNATSWPVNDRPSSLSVNARHSVIVTCSRVGKIKEFSPRGELLRDVTLPGDVINPWHAVQLRCGEFVVCHGGDDPSHGVSRLSWDGRRVVHSHAGQPGSDAGQYDVPYHLAVDDDEFVFVSDRNNRRVTLLSPTLGEVGGVVSRNQFKWKVQRLCLDVVGRRLYVTDNERKDGEYTAGRCVVFRLQ